jgi:hypothetical protein
MFIGAHVKYRLLLSDFNELDYSGQIVEKYSCIKLLKKCSCGSRAVQCGQTDRHDEAYSRLQEFCESAKTKTFNGCILDPLYSIVFRVTP